MEFKQIQELLKAVNKLGLSEVAIKDGEFEISIKKEGQEQPQMVAVPGASSVPSAGVPQYLPQAAVPAQAPSAAPEASAPVQKEEEEDANLVVVKSPMIGTFYRSSGPDKSAFVSVGDVVKPGSVLCIVEAMKLFNEIESEVSGRIVKVLVEDASPVEYDQPLFLVEPE